MEKRLRFVEILLLALITLNIVSIGLDINDRFEEDKPIGRTGGVLVEDIYLDEPVNRDDFEADYIICLDCP
ncbi:hypothetical protein [Flagellimonas sp.]|uniref:hypothetical protein n=1 Tax=Flagellimonas sp. TaxID=2058762 RepID=UPI003BAA1DAD